MSDISMESAGTLTPTGEAENMDIILDAISETASVDREVAQRVIDVLGELGVLYKKQVLTDSELHRSIFEDLSHRDKVIYPTYTSNNIERLPEQVAERIRTVQAEAKERLEQSYPTLHPFAKQGLRYLGINRHLYGNRYGGFPESLDSCLKRHIVVEPEIEVPIDTDYLDPIKWLIFKCVDQDNEPEYWVHHVYMKPLREVLVAQEAVVESDFKRY